MQNSTGNTGLEGSHGTAMGVWGQLPPPCTSIWQPRGRGGRLCSWLLGGMEQIPKYQGVAGRSTAWPWGTERGLSQGLWQQGDMLSLQGMCQC